jgi:hypothetical protein
MTTTLPDTLSSETPTAPSQLIATVLEPVFVAASCLFWVVVLPISGLFCAGVASYDYFAALKVKGLPVLRNRPSNPLVLRSKPGLAAEPHATASRAGHAAQA